MNGLAHPRGWGSFSFSFFFFFFLFFSLLTSGLCLGRLIVDTWGGYSYSFIPACAGVVGCYIQLYLYPLLFIPLSILLPPVCMACFPPVLFFSFLSCYVLPFHFFPWLGLFSYGRRVTAMFNYRQHQIMIIPFTVILCTTKQLQI